jgi:hypothetical protein
MSMSTICPGGTYQAWHVDAINQNYTMAVPFNFKSITSLIIPVTVMSLIFWAWFTYDIIDGCLCLIYIYDVMICTMSLMVPVADLYIVLWFAWCHDCLFPVMSLMVPISDLHMMSWFAWYHDLQSSFR